MSSAAATIDRSALDELLAALGFAGAVDVMVIVGSTLAALTLGATTLRRRTA